MFDHVLTIFDDMVFKRANVNHRFILRMIRGNWMPQGSIWPSWKFGSMSWLGRPQVAQLIAQFFPNSYKITIKSKFAIGI